MITGSGSGVDLDEFQVVFIECLQRRETHVKVKVIQRSNPGLTRIMRQVQMHGVDNERERENTEQSPSHWIFPFFVFNFPGKFMFVFLGMNRILPKIEINLHFGFYRNIVSKTKFHKENHLQKFFFDF